MTLAALMLLAVPTPAGATSCLPGTGTASDPFLVASAADLAKVGKDAANGCTLAAHYLQTADVTLSGTWTPIGAWGSEFTGTYDGGGHTIDGLVINLPTTDDVGLFGRTIGATLRRIALTRAAVTGRDDTGMLVGDASGTTIEDVSASGTVTGSVQYTGGLVGFLHNNTIVRRSWSDGAVSGVADVGGLVGYVDLGEVRASFSTADVTATGNSVGGLVGSLADDLTDVYARGEVSHGGSSERVGGLVGEHISGSIARAVSTGAVSPSGTNVGGFVGRELSGSTTEGYWDTQTSGLATSAAGTGRTTAQMTSIANSATWPIVDGWAPYDVSAGRVWGICPRVNDGYPFLLWQYGSDPCTAPAAAPQLAVTCTGPGGGGLVAGSAASCTLTGADADIDILWRAAHNPTFAQGVLRTGTDGTATFGFTVPRAATGDPVTVELVAWTAPIPVGTAGTASAATAGPVTTAGPVPTAVDAGTGASGTLPSVPALAALLAGLLTAVGTVGRNLTVRQHAAPPRSHRRRSATLQSD